MTDDAILVLVDQTPAIAVELESERCLFYDDDIVITEISQEKRATMGRPLDITNEADAKLAFDALLNKDPAYTIEVSDMVPSEITLRSLMDRYYEGYSLEAIAYAVV